MSTKPNIARKLSEQNQNVLICLEKWPASLRGATAQNICTQTGLLGNQLSNSLHFQSALRTNQLIENISNTSISRWKITDAGRALLTGKSPDLTVVGTPIQTTEQLSAEGFSTPAPRDHKSDPPAFLSITSNHDILIIHHNQSISIIPLATALPLAKFLRSLPDNHPLLTAP